MRRKKIRKTRQEHKARNLRPRSDGEGESPFTTEPPFEFGGVCHGFVRTSRQDKADQENEGKQGKVKEEQDKTRKQKKTRHQRQGKDKNEARLNKTCPR
jgi:hypothetical protein